MGGCGRLERTIVIDGSAGPEAAAEQGHRNALQTLEYMTE